MMKGFLNIMILKELSSEDFTGYDLLKIFKDKYDGVSPGSLYPMLSNLEENKYIKSKEDGKKKIYSITSNGKKTLLTLMRKKREMMASFVDYTPDMKRLVGDEMENMGNFMKLLHQPGYHFVDVSFGMSKIREVVTKVGSQGNLSDNGKRILSKKIENILNNAAKEISKL